MRPTIRPKIALIGLAVFAAGLYMIPKAMSASRHLILQWSTGASVYLGRGDLELQQTDMSCGPAALSYLLRLLGQNVTQIEIGKIAGTTGQGTSLLGLSKAAEHFGYATEAWKLDPAYPDALNPPVLVHFPDHFVVVVKVSPNHVTVADPAVGILQYTWVNFSKKWDGVVLKVGKSAQGKTPEGSFSYRNMGG